MAKPYDFDGPKWHTIYGGMKNDKLKDEAFSLRKKLMKLQQKSDFCANSISCLQAEGPEFMSRQQINDAISNEATRLLAAVRESE